MGKTNPPLTMSRPDKLSWLDSKWTTFALALLIVSVALIALSTARVHWQIHEQRLSDHREWSQLRGGFIDLDRAILALLVPMQQRFASGQVGEAESSLAQAQQSYRHVREQITNDIPPGATVAERERIGALLAATDEHVATIGDNCRQSFARFEDQPLTTVTSQATLVGRHATQAFEQLGDYHREISQIVQRSHERSIAEEQTLIKTALSVGLTLLALSVALVVHHCRISQHNRRLTALAEHSTVQLQAIMDSTVDPIITINERGQIINFNRAGEREFGYRSTQVLGKNINMLMPEPYASEHDSYLDRYRRTGVPHVIGKGREAVGKRADGSTFPIELSVSEVQISNERFFSGIVRNITDQKFAESQLAKARDEAEAANRAKSEFLANMSHEIRTPMTAILGYSEMLVQEDGLERAPEERRHALHTVRRSGQFLLELINDILDLSRIEAGRMHVQQIDCAIAQVIAEVASLMRVRADEKRLSLAVRYDTAVPAWFASDPTRLRQVLINLVGNAIKFTETGSVTIVTRVVNRDQPGARLEIVVIDTGIGMTEEQIGTLFQPFTQADSSLSRRYGGTGLGLCISKRLMEMLGGSIDVESQPQVGTQFTVSLPLEGLDGAEWLEQPSESVTVKRTQPEPLTVPERLDCRVLLVEDGPDNQRLISHLLKKAGADVLIATNGVEGVKAAEQAVTDGRPFDVILMDMQMPVMDGYAATRTLREHGYTRPIIALTAHAMSGDDRKCLDCGCDDYATKPIARDRLIGIVAKHVELTLQSV